MNQGDHTSALYAHKNTAVLAVFFGVFLQPDVHPLPAGVLYLNRDSLYWRTADMADGDLLPSADVGVRRFFELVRELATSSQAWTQRGYFPVLELEERPERLAQLQISGANLQLLDRLRSVIGEAWKQV